MLIEPRRAQCGHGKRFAAQGNSMNGGSVPWEDQRTQAQESSGVRRLD